MGKLGEQETKVNSVDVLSSDESGDEEKKETEDFIPLPTIDVPKKKRTLSEKQREALQRGREKRLQMAKDRKNKTIQQPQQASEEEEEKKVEVLLDKYLGRQMKKAAEAERKRRSLPVEDLSENDQYYDSDENIPSQVPVLKRQKAYVVESKKLKQPPQSCMFL